MLMVCLRFCCVWCVCGCECDGVCVGYDCMCFGCVCV